jgi:rubrerythrin
MDRKETYRLAIEAEIRSQKLYQTLSRSFQKPETYMVFQELILLERNHEEKVRTAFEGEFPGQEIDSDPPLDMELRHLNLKDPKQVLDYAISREEAARQIYLDLAGDTAEPELKDMLLRFAAQQRDHKTLLLT